MAANGEQGVEGSGETLHDAIVDAWKKAPKQGHTKLEVTAIHVHGDNPLTGYIVVLGRPGGG